MPFKKILVAVEFPGAKQQLGLARARQLARKSGAKLELFHAAYDTEIGEVVAPARDPRVQYVLDIRRRQLEALRSESKLEPAECAVNVLWSHSVVDAISQEIEAQQPDLVIAESTRRGRFARFVLTNTDWELIRHLPAPLLLVKSAKPVRNAPILCAVDPTHAHAKPAELDDAILEAGKDFAQALGCRLTVYHAYPSAAQPPLSLATGVSLPLPLRAGKEERAARRQKQVKQVAALAERHRLQMPRVVVEEGDVRELLVERAGAERAQIVVLGAVARGGLDRMLIGSTTESVLDQLACDVLAVKPVRSSRARRHPR